MSRVAQSGSGDPAWSLAPGVHGVAVGEDLVLLDIGADAYFCLPGAAAILTLDAGGGLTATDPGAIEAMADAGLARRGTKPDNSTPPPKPMRNLPRAGVVEGGASRCLWRILRAGTATSRDFRRLDFAGLLETAARGRGPRDISVAAPSDVLLSTAWRFAQLRVWMPFDGACLKRSYMMLRYLRLCGLDAVWVIGVRTWPFRAHCWLQAGDIALDEDAERLLAYRPILAV
jgi:hypothetical protein